MGIQVSSPSEPPNSELPREVTYRLGRLGLWASADAAAVLAALLERGFRRTLEAAEAALLLVTSVFFLRAIAMVSFQEMLMGLPISDQRLHISVTLSIQFLYGSKSIVTQALKQGQKRANLAMRSSGVLKAAGVHQLLLGLGLSHEPWRPHQTIRILHLPSVSQSRTVPRDCTAKLINEPSPLCYRATGAFRQVLKVEDAGEELSQLPGDNQHNLSLKQRRTVVGLTDFLLL